MLLTANVVRPIIAFIGVLRSWDMANKKDDSKLKCSFCGKTQEEVKKIVAGPGVYICNECIDLCKEIIDEEFYEEAVNKYGKYLDKEGITAGFYQKDNPAVWAKYVLIPLYEHYKANPIPNDCPFAESGNQGEFWRDPVALYR